MELLLPESRWPEANCVSCFQNNPCLYVHFPHTHSPPPKKNLAGTKQKQAHVKNRSLTHILQPTAIQISVLPFCSVKGTIFSSCLTWLFEYFQKHLQCCVMETLPLNGNCLNPVVTSSSPSSFGISLSLVFHGFIFPCAPLLPSGYSPGCHLSAHLLALSGTYNCMAHIACY